MRTCNDKSRTKSGTFGEVARTNEYSVFAKRNSIFGIYKRAYVRKRLNEFLRLREYQKTSYDARDKS